MTFFIIIFDFSLKEVELQCAPSYTHDVINVIIKAFFKRSGKHGWGMGRPEGRDVHINNEWCEKLVSGLRLPSQASIMSWQLWLLNKPCTSGSSLPHSKNCLSSTYDHQTKCLCSVNSDGHLSITSTLHWQYFTHYYFVTSSHIQYNIIQSSLEGFTIQAWLNYYNIIFILLLQLKAF